jgi:hypothetical protein
MNELKGRQGLKGKLNSFSQSKLKYGFPLQETPNT